MTFLPASMLVGFTKVLLTFESEKLRLIKNNYILVSCHREENVGNFYNLNSIFIALNEISKKIRE
jgi:UDP-N-acetylglucosamine 2-epimerase